MTDINELCKQLGCTSRTLRFYEEKGLIKSTTDGYNNRRKYTDEQVANIKNVFVLRSLGMPVSKIQQYLSDNVPLTDIIKERQNDLYIFIAKLNREYSLLCDALSTIENGGDIFSGTDKQDVLTDKQHIASKVIDLFILGDYHNCFEYFSPLLKEYLPLTAFIKIAKDTLKLTGSIISTEHQIHYEQNSYFACVKCEKHNLYIKLVLFSNQIQGIWLTL